MFEARNICKSYNGRPVLNDLNLSLSPGQALGIRGENGCGKSTLLRILAHVEKPDSGEVLLDGRSLSRQDLRSVVAYVPQKNSLAPYLTVKGQLSLWRAACGCGRSSETEIVELLGLGDIYNAETRTLSGGQQKRVSIAMALLPEPKLLLMDEACSGLDENYTEKLRVYLGSFVRNGGGLILCSHDASEMNAVCTDICELSQINNLKCSEE